VTLAETQVGPLQPVGGSLELRLDIFVFLLLVAGCATLEDMAEHESASEKIEPHWKLRGLTAIR
jgi:hypothetical protein